MMESVTGIDSEPITCTLADLEYALPSELIAQQPSPRREDSRLLAVERKTNRWRDATILDLPQLLNPGDLLVLNDTRVVPAKFSVRRASGRILEGLFVEELEPGRWQVMLRGSSRLRQAETLEAGSAETLMRMTLTERHGGGMWTVKVHPPEAAFDLLSRIGRTPLPPYIHRDGPDVSNDADDRERYQTVYARVPGAVAAPTAGLHLTESLLKSIEQRGIDIAYVTLHVGIGTFKPISAESLERHAMHAERLAIPTATAEAVGRCKSRGGRVVAVGTTAVRALESSVDEHGGLRAFEGTTNLFIVPPYDFKIVDAMLTNFHLPKSTLLALVMAFAGVGLTRRAYEHAVASRYRFYSFGDAMFIH